MTDSPKPSSLHAPTLLPIAGARQRRECARSEAPSATSRCGRRDSDEKTGHPRAAARCPENRPLLNPRAVRGAAITQPEFSFASRTINAR